MHSKAQHTCKISTDEAIYAMKDLTDNAFKLLIYYYSRSSGWAFSDDEISSTIGVTKRTVSNLRKELVDKGYLHIEKGNINNYFVGRKAVFEWNNPDEEEAFRELNLGGNK